MDLEHSARVRLSGGLEHRRGYLTTTITSWNQLALTVTLAIWGFLAKWDVIANQQLNWGVFALQVGWASSLSSIFIGLWRLYVHEVDHAIVRLYPAIYLCERLLLPPQVSTVKPPNSIEPLREPTNATTIVFTKVQQKDFGGRGHVAMDCIGVTVILAFGVATLVSGASWWFLMGNGVGVGLIGFASLRWQNRELDWPVSKNREADTGAVSAQGERISDSAF